MRALISNQNTLLKEDLKITQSQLSLAERVLKWEFKKCCLGIGLHV